MSTKTIFKRVSLAMVAALGFGVLSTGSASADIQAGSTMTVTATDATAVAGVDTAIAKIDFTFTSITGTGDGTKDTVTVTAIQTAGTTTHQSFAWAAPAAADSSNAVAMTQASNVLTVVPDSGKAVTFTGYAVMTPSASSAAASYTFTFYAAFSSNNASATKPAPVTFTYTVSAANTKPAAAQSSVYMVGLTGGSGGTGVTSFTANNGDSTVVRTAGTVGSFDSVATLVWLQRNSDSATVSAGPTVAESVTATITGAGTLSVGFTGTKASAVTAGNHQYITVWSDGRGGVATITLTSTSMTTWATKTLTFFSTAKSASLSAVVGKVSKTGNDSATALRVVLKDANSQIVAGTATNMYIHSSDTKVVTNGLCSVTVDATLGYGNCSLSGRVADSGTTKIKVANYAYESISTHAALTTSFVSAEEVTIQVVGAPKTIKATFDKATYNPGEEATVTLKLTDGLGNVVDTHTSLSGALTSTGLDYNVGTDMTETVITFGAGVKTYTYVMPSTGQKVTLSYTGGAGISGGTQTADSVTVIVKDPAEEAANSALDAAQEATDAAIAATDAAVLAQESADAAAVAAEAAAETAAEAADAAKAAVDAVTKLSAEVTKLLTQFATLQKLMTRIAKKVGVKV